MPALNRDVRSYPESGNWPTDFRRLLCAKSGNYVAFIYGVGRQFGESTSRMIH